MRYLSVHALLAALLLSAALSGCAPRALKQGDMFAKKGDWEQALIAYREVPRKSNATLNRVAKAEGKVAAIYVARGNEAKAQAKWGEAGEWWRQALELRPDDVKKTGPRGVIEENAEALEKFADAAVTEKKWQDAFHAYGPLLAVYKDKLELANKSEAAHKTFAVELDTQAMALGQRGLTGAALVAEIRALQHDPLHPLAFDRSTQYRKAVRQRTLIGIPAVTMQDRGFWGLGNAMAPRLTSRLGLYPPYGPTKNKDAVPAVFEVTIEEFSWFDRVEHGIERRTDPAKTGNPKEQVPNPERPPQQALIKFLEKEVKDLESARAASIGGPAAAETPAPGKKDAKKKDAVAKKEEKKTTGEKKFFGLAARVATEEEIQKKRDELAAAIAAFDKMPETVDGGSAATVWTLAWSERTRTVSARVRFEVKESDFAEPVVITRDLKVDAKDRMHSGDEPHQVPADPLDLPSVEKMVNDLADRFADGTDVIRDARARRTDRLLSQGRTALSAGSEDEALDAYVSALFIAGPTDFPTDAATLVATRMENKRLKDVLVSP